MRTLAAALVLAACGDAGGLVAGDGIAVVELRDRGVLAIDPERVPSADCTGTLRRTEVGWRCSELDPASLAARLAAVEALAGELAALEAHVAALEPLVAGAESELVALGGLAAALRAGEEGAAAARARRSLSVPAAACVPAGADLLDGRLIWDRGAFTSAPGVSLWGYLYCPIFAPGPVTSWDAGVHIYRDPDGLARRAVVLGPLQVAPDSTEESAFLRVDSNFVAETSTHARTVLLRGTPFSGSPAPYVVQKILLNAGSSPVPSRYYGFHMVQRGVAAPPELAQPGGELRISAGWHEDIVDDAGRTWHTDDLFLVPGHGPTRTHAASGMIDQSLLSPPGLPERMLLTERWCECDLVYRMAVPAGDYRVTAYFSENCPNCASRSIGGARDEPEPLHVIGIRVEDQRVGDYAPGATAGRIFRATQLDFDVSVTDGSLDIICEDLGPGLPPGDSMLKGLLVRRTR